MFQSIHVPDFACENVYQYTSVAIRYATKEVSKVREMLKHNAGRVFVIVLFLSIVGMLFVTRYFTSKVVVFGWITLPLFSGIIFVLVWLVAYLVYFFKFWPYR
jgi:hypothetical protein